MSNNEVAIVNAVPCEATANVLPYIIQLRRFYINFANTAEEASKKLDDVADALDKHTQNVNIANVSGATGELAGALMCAVGFGLSFYTFGASLGLGIAGEQTGKCIT